MGELFKRLIDEIGVLTALIAVPFAAAIHLYLVPILPGRWGSIADLMVLAYIVVLYAIALLPLILVRRASEVAAEWVVHGVSKLRQRSEGDAKAAGMPASPAAPRDPYGPIPIKYREALRTISENERRVLVYFVQNFSQSVRAETLLKWAKKMEAPATAIDDLVNAGLLRLSKNHMTYSEILTVPMDLFRALVQVPQLLGATVAPRAIAR